MEARIIEPCATVEDYQLWKRGEKHSKSRAAQPADEHKKTTNNQTLLKEAGNSGDVTLVRLFEFPKPCSCVVSYSNGTTILVVCSALTREANPERQGTGTEVKMP